MANMWEPNLFIALALGVMLAAAAGFRVFVPLLLTGVVLRLGLFPLPSAIAGGHSWLASNTALVCFGVATIVEVLAYKIPYLDHVLDLVGAPAALASGTALASTFLTGIEDPALRYGLGLLSGAGAAGLVHAGTATARLLSTKTTAGIANPVFSFAELIASVVTSLLALIVPALALIVFLAFGFYAYFFYRRRAAKGPVTTPPESSNPYA